MPCRKHLCSTNYNNYPIYTLLFIYMARRLYASSTTLMAGRGHALGPNFGITYTSFLFPTCLEID